MAPGTNALSGLGAGLQPHLLLAARQIGEPHVRAPAYTCPSPDRANRRTRHSASRGTGVRPPRRVMRVTRTEARRDVGGNMRQIGAERDLLRIAVARPAGLPVSR
jgi:hypothetical protein